MVEVVFAEQIVEELQACRGEFHRRARRGEDWSDQLLPGEVEIVTVTEPERGKQSRGSLLASQSPTYFLSIVQVVS